MLPLIVGTVAIATIGYGIKKCFTDEDCMDAVKDKIQDAAFTAVDGIDYLDEKLGLNEVRLKEDDPEHELAMSMLDALPGMLAGAPIRIAEMPTRIEIVPNQVEKETPPTIKSSAKARLDEFFTLTSTLQNFEDKDTLSQEFKLNDLVYSNEYKQYIEITEYILTLHKVSKLLHARVQKIKEILNGNTNYQEYTQEHKKEINKAFILANILQDLLKTKLFKKSGAVNKNLEDAILIANRYLFKIKEQDKELTLSFKNFLQEPIFVDLS